MKYTESQIKSIGSQRWLKRKGKRILLLLALGIAWIFAVNFFMPKPSIIVLIAPLVLVVINVVWGYIQARNVFYRKVKENPELLNK